jgi:hypothetical protein
MLRNVLKILVLAALTATSALGSPAVSATTHRHASSPIHTHASAHTGRATLHPQAAATHRASARPQPRTSRTASHSRYSINRASAHNFSYHPGRHHYYADGIRLRQRYVRQHPETAIPTGPPIEQTVSLRRNATLLPSPLKGSLESLTRQNEMAEAEGLERILDEDDLADRIAHGLLVPVPVSGALTINQNLPENHRYCRPWTATFLTDLAHAHQAQFRRPLDVSSAVRTVEYQKQLMRVNGNAAAAEGEVASPHLTGSTIDIVKQGMNRQELAWMRGWLLSLQLAGQIDVEEEFRQSCFHITVYKSYVTPAPAATRAPTLTTPSQLATSVR